MEDMEPRNSLCTKMRTVGYHLYSKGAADPSVYTAVVVEQVLKKEDGK